MKSIDLIKAIEIVRKYNLKVEIIANKTQSEMDILLHNISEDGYCSNNCPCLSCCLYIIRPGKYGTCLKNYDDFYTDDNGDSVIFNSNKFHEVVNQIKMVCKS